MVDSRGTCKSFPRLAIARPCHHTLTRPHTCTIRWAGNTNQEVRTRHPTNSAPQANQECPGTSPSREHHQEIGRVDHVVVVHIGRKTRARRDVVEEVPHLDGRADVPVARLARPVMPPANNQVVLQQCFSIDRTVGLELHDASVAGIKVGQKTDSESVVPKIERQRAMVSGME